MHGFSNIWEAARFRSRVYRSLRDFFLSREYLEVETPLLSPDLIPESAIEIFKTEKFNFLGESTERYLVPSPEVWMKKLLSQGSPSLFQISKCFRNSEQSGRLHSNEFSMLEWYAIDRDYRDNIDLTEDLFRALAPLASAETRAYFTEPFLLISIEEAFIKWAGFSLEEKGSIAGLQGELNSRNIPYDGNDDEEVLFNRAFLTLVEPSLPVDRTVVLTDYPAFVPTLSRRKEGTLWCERWEMYIAGMEVANCYTEETVKSRITEYFALEGKAKESARVPHGIDSRYGDFFHKDYPAVSGNAIGLDRLIMALSGADSIKDVLLFPDGDR